MNGWFVSLSLCVVGVGCRMSHVSARIPWYSQFFFLNPLLFILLFFTLVRFPAPAYGWSLVGLIVTVVLPHR